MIWKRTVVFLAASLLCLETNFGSGASLAAPSVSTQAADLSLPSVKRDTLLNGLRLITLPQGGTGEVKIHLRINSGSLFDLAGKGGLADITARMTLKGGAGYTSKNVVDTASALGLTINEKVTWDSTDFVVSGPSASFEQIMDLLGRLLATPTFSQADLDQVKAQRLSELIAEPKDGSLVAGRIALQALFGTFPYGRPEEGTAYSIARVTRDDLVFYHDRFYIANNAELAVIGDISADDTTKIARAKLGIWKKGDIIPATFRPPVAPQTRQIYLIDTPADAASVAVAEIGITRRANDYFPTVIAAALFEMTAAKSPDMAIHSELAARTLAGPFLVSSRSPLDKAADRVEQIIAGMSQIAKGQTTPDQIQQVKSQLISAYLKGVAGQDGLVAALLEVDLYGLGRDYIINYANRVDAVTPADIMQAAQSHLNPESVVVIVTGPAAKLEPALRRLGAVSVVKDQQTSQ